MMLALATAALVNAAATAPSIVTTDQLPSLFISACLDGRAQMGSATPIEFDALPSGLRSRLGKPSGAQVWKLQGVDDAYLYSLSYTDRSFSPRICGVAAKNMVLRPASAAVESRLRGGAPAAGSFRPVEWLNHEAGYRALATRAGGFTVLQVDWLNGENKTEAAPTQ